MSLDSLARSASAQAAAVAANALASARLAADDAVAAAAASSMCVAIVLCWNGDPVKEGNTSSVGRSRDVHALTAYRSVLCTTYIAAGQVRFSVPLASFPDFIGSSTLENYRYTIQIRPVTEGVEADAVSSNEGAGISTSILGETQQQLQLLSPSRFADLLRPRLCATRLAQQLHARTTAAADEAAQESRRIGALARRQEWGHLLLFLVLLLVMHCIMRFDATGCGCDWGFAAACTCESWFLSSSSPPAFASLMSAPALVRRSTEGGARTVTDGCARLYENI